MLFTFAYFSIGPNDTRDSYRIITYLFFPFKPDIALFVNSSRTAFIVLARFYASLQSKIEKVQMYFGKLQTLFLMAVN